MARKSTTKKSSKTTKPRTTKSTTTKKETVKKETKKVDKTQELSNTFISEVGQKSAIANLEDEIVEKREKETTNKPKKGKAFKTFIIMLICLIVGAAASYCYFEVLNTNKDKNVVIKYKSRSAKFGYDIDSIAVKYLIDDYDYVGSFQVNLYNYLYSADEINVKDIEQDYLKLLAIKKADTDRDGVVSSIEFNEAVDYLFGGDIEFNNDSIKTDDILCAKYDYENGEYKQKDNECKGSSDLKLQRKILDVKEKRNKLEVTVAIAILDTNKDKVGKSLTFDEDGASVLGDELDGVKANDFVIDTSTDDLNKFVYTFKYSKDNKNYYLENIKLDN